METVTATVKERPIFFTADMVNAILDGRKTQTRRVMRDQPSEDWRPHGRQDEVHKMVDGDFIMGRGAPVVMGYGYSNYDGDEGYACPYGKPSDHLYVRESWAHDRQFDHLAPTRFPESAQNTQHVVYGSDIVQGWHRKRASIHMPKWASRIMLELTEVRAERVQDISEAEILAEGITVPIAAQMTGIPWSDMPTLHHAWRYVWDHINAGRGYGWDKNPWTWVLTFERLER